MQICVSFSWESSLNHYQRVYVQKGLNSHWSWGAVWETLRNWEGKISQTTSFLKLWAPKTHQRVLKGDLRRMSLKFIEIVEEKEEAEDPDGDWAYGDCPQLTAEEEDLRKRLNIQMFIHKKRHGHSGLFRRMLTFFLKENSIDKPKDLHHSMDERRISTKSTLALAQPSELSIDEVGLLHLPLPASPANAKIDSPEPH